MLSLYELRKNKDYVDYTGNVVDSVHVMPLMIKWSPWTEADSWGYFHKSLLFCVPRSVKSLSCRMTN